MNYTIEEFCDAHHACKGGRDWALANCETMQEAWGKAESKNVVWIALQKGVLTDKELRLFAVFCARQNQHLLTDQRSIDAIDVAERYANGNATDDELHSALAAAAAAARAAAYAAYAAYSADAAYAAARVADAAYAASYCAASYFARAARAALAAADAAYSADAARAAQSDYLKSNTKPNFTKP